MHRNLIMTVSSRSYTSLKRKISDLPWLSVYTEGECVIPIVKYHDGTQVSLYSAVLRHPKLTSDEKFDLLIDIFYSKGYKSFVAKCLEQGWLYSKIVESVPRFVCYAYSCYASFDNHPLAEEDLKRIVNQIIDNNDEEDFIYLLQNFKKRDDVQSAVSR